MSRLVGKVHFTATIDGKKMPSDAERVGRQAGAAAGDGYDKEWQKSFRDTLTRAGRDSLDRWKKSGKADGDIYGREWTNRFKVMIADAEKAFTGLRFDTGFLDAYSKEFEDAGFAARDLQEKIKLLRDEHVITNQQYVAGRKQLEDWVVDMRKAAVASDENSRAMEDLGRQLRGELLQSMEDVAKGQERFQRQMEDYGRSIREVGDDVDEVEVKHRRLGERFAWLKKFDFWTKLDGEVKIVIALIAAAADQIAVLGSALGAGLIGLGAAATSGIVGISAFASIAVNLFQDLEDAPDDMKGIIREFGRFKDSLADLNDEIARAAFRELQGAFDSLASTLTGLQGPLSDVGRVIGSAFSDLADSIKPGAEGFDLLSETVRNAVPNFDALLRLTGKLGGALLQAFDGAQPLVEQMFGWIDRVFTQFDEFTRSNGMDLWVTDSMKIWTSFGGLLDSVLRTLNDLASPAAVGRTQALLDNLAGFAPALGGILDVIGTLDPLGLLALALNEIGEAITPMLPTLLSLADALNEHLAGAVLAIADGFRAAALVITPLAAAFTLLLDAIPPEVTRAAATGLVTLALAFGVFKAGGAIYGAITAVEALGGKISQLTTRLDGAAGAGGKLKGALGFMGKAGLVGIAATAVVGLAAAARELAKDLLDLDDKARNAVAGSSSLKDAMSDLLVGFDETLLSVDGLAQKLAGLDQFNNWAFDASTAAEAARQVAAGLRELDVPLTALAQTSLPDAQKQLRAWGDEIGAVTDGELMGIINSMPTLKQQLIDLAVAEDGAASDADLLRLAFGGATDAAATQTDILAGLAGGAEDAHTQVEGLADAIRNFGSTTLDAREAERQFQEAIDSLTTSVGENGRSLDINTEKGRANEAALDDVAQSALEYAAALYEQTSDQALATEAVQKGRDQLIKMLEQFGITGEAAEDYADDLGLIPENIETFADFKMDLSSYDSWIDKLNAIPNSIVTTARVQGTGGTAPRATATGGLFNSGSVRLIGEAGPEAVVPLNRALNQVDPSVRWLSAIAQGKGAPAMANGGVVGGGKSVNVEAGAIVVAEAGDGRRAANDVMTRIVEYVNS